MMTPAPLFRDRTDAGKQLAEAIVTKIAEIETGDSPLKAIVYALPRGGLPVAVPIVQRLGCPLDIIVAKKISRPQNPELAIGAVTADGEVLWTKQRVLKFRLQVALQQEAQAKAQEQYHILAPACPQVDPLGSIAIVVDDGIATGMTMAAAAQALRKRKLAQLWICAPVAPLELMSVLPLWCDRTIILETPHPFFSVSRFYEEFPQVEMEEAIACLHAQGRGGEWVSR